VREGSLKERPRLAPEEVPVDGEVEGLEEGEAVVEEAAGVVVGTTGAAVVVVGSSAGDEVEDEVELDATAKDEMEEVS
jgi:hypothetical protein